MTTEGIAAAVGIGFTFLSGALAFIGSVIKFNNEKKDMENKLERAREDNDVQAGQIKDLQTKCEILKDQFIELKTSQTGVVKEVASSLQRFDEKLDEHKAHTTQMFTSTTKMFAQFTGHMANEETNQKALNDRMSTMEFSIKTLLEKLT